MDLQCMYVQPSCENPTVRVADKLGQNASNLSSAAGLPLMALANSQKEGGEMAVQFNNEKRNVFQVWVVHKLRF